jgi:hypothetical protein
LINFKFDEGNGASVAAATPYTNLTGTVSNTSWAGGVDGQSANALSFNGSTSYISIPNNNLFAVSEDGVTFAAWVKPGSLNSSGHNMVVSHGSGPDNYLSVCNTHVCLKIIANGGVSNYCSSLAQLSSGTWYHIAGTYDREGKMKVFINGQQDGSTAGPFLNPDTSPGALNIGKYAASGFFNGIIDDVQICRKGCTGKEIRQLKDKAIIAYSFPLNEGTGTAAYDSFDNSRQAVITGATWHGNTALDKKDNALYFDGVNDFATITGSSTAFRTDGSNGFTFAAWIKSDGTFPGGHDPVIARGSTYLSIYGGKLGFKTLTGSANTSRWCAGSSTLTSSTWHHVAAVYEADGNMKVYLDGVQDGNTAGPYPNQSNEIYNIQLGTYGSYFKGIISNARIYKRGLTANEIYLLYQNKE